LQFFRKRQDRELEDRLRSLSAEPKDDFVRSLSTEVRKSRAHTAMRSRRLVAALVTSGLMIVPFVAFGGVSYAAAAAKSAVQSVSNTGNSNSADKNKGNNNSGDNNKGNNNSGDNNVGNNNSGDNNKGNNNTPDDDQYKPGKGCGDKNHEHERDNECKKPPK
jgi:hypothetical protein